MHGATLCDLGKMMFEWMRARVLYSFVLLLLGFLESCGVSARCAVGWYPHFLVGRYPHIVVFAGSFMLVFVRVFCLHTLCGHATSECVWV
jgi:hypothetical protein